MSTIQVANLHFETTGANRIEYTGNNVVRVRANGGFQLPFGTSAQRANGDVGLIRYNTDTGLVESFGGAGTWDALPSGPVFNVAYGVANAAFARANSALQNTSGTFAGDLSITGNVGIGTNFSSKFFEIRRDQNSETSLWITNNNSIAPGTNNSIIFGGYRDIDSNYQVAKISAIHGTGSSANANHSGALAFFTQQAVGLSNPELPIERMRIDSAGRVTMPFQSYCRVVSSAGNVTVSAGTNIIPFNSALNNVGGHFNTSNYRFTLPVTGKYLVSASIQLNGGAAQYYNLYIRLNASGQFGTFQTGENMSYQQLSTVGTVLGNASDYIDIALFAVTGSGTIEASGDSRCSLSIILLG